VHLSAKNRRFLHVAIFYLVLRAFIAWSDPPISSPQA
jgi:hypothetical protein